MQRLRKLDRALVEGRWFEHSKSTRVFADIAIGVGLAASAAATAYGISSQSGIANRQLSIADDQRSKQDQSFQQLQQLISDPSSFFKSPVYQAAFDQGTHAVSRQQAAGGYLGSGNEAAALQSYGQSFGQQQLFNQEQLLAGMSGTGFNPAGAVGGAGQSAQNVQGSINNLAGLMSFFGNSGGGGMSGMSGAGGGAGAAGVGDGWGG